MNDRPALAELMAPSLADIEGLAEVAHAALPAGFRALTRGLVILVDEFPTDEVLAELGAESEFDILGLFQGVGLAQGGALMGGALMGGALSGTGQMPNTVHLYRRPLLDFWAENEETLGDLVTHVLVHEIGHHFGLSDADMEAIEAEAREG